MDFVKRVTKTLDPNTTTELQKVLVSTEVYSYVEQTLKNSPAELVEFFSTIFDWYKNGDLQQQLVLIQFIPFLLRDYVFSDEQYGAFLCIYNCEVQQRKLASNENKLDYLPIDGDKTTQITKKDFDFLPFYGDVKVDNKWTILRIVLQVYDKNIMAMPKENHCEMSKVIFEVTTSGMPYKIPKYTPKLDLATHKMEMIVSKGAKYMIPGSLLNEFANVMKNVLIVSRSDSVVETVYSLYLKSLYELNEEGLLNVSSLFTIINA
jgi:hypothetical protein